MGEGATAQRERGEMRSRAEVLGESREGPPGPCTGAELQRSERKGEKATLRASRTHCINVIKSASARDD